LPLRFVLGFALGVVGFVGLVERELVVVSVAGFVLVVVDGWWSRSPIPGHQQY
jgi:hypothetical protein